LESPRQCSLLLNQQTRHSREFAANEQCLNDCAVSRLDTAQSFIYVFLVNLISSASLANNKNALEDKWGLFRLLSLFNLYHSMLTYSLEEHETKCTWPEVNADLSFK